MKTKTSDKYLGDVVDEGGLGASVMATIMNRRGKVVAAMLEAAGIVEDFRAQCVGGFMVALDLWQVAILPTLLYNCNTWV